LSAWAQSKHADALVSENSSSVSNGCGEGALDGTLETVTDHPHVPHVIIHLQTGIRAFGLVLLGPGQEITIFTHDPVVAQKQTFLLAMNAHHPPGMLKTL
jgi:hypothetical protein